MDSFLPRRNGFLRAIFLEYTSHFFLTERSKMTYMTYITNIINMGLS